MNILLALMITAASPGQEAWRKAGLDVAPPPPLTKFESIRPLAFAYIGRPYTMGGVGRPAFDCSGFVGRVYAEAGYGLPRVSRDQAKVGQAVDLNDLEPGDLVFFAEQGQPISHVGMYLGDGELIHASSGQGRVVVASLRSGWLGRHLVAARRILGGPRYPATNSDFLEVQEHQGQFALVPMLRRPARLPEPSYGPELPGVGYTALGSRAAFLTEGGSLGITLAPEASLVYSPWGLELTLAVPIRFPFDDSPTVGEFNSFRDYMRFLRTARLGLRGADLELAFSRLGDLTVGSGSLVDHLAPGTTVAGVPGLTVAPSPLGTTLGVRWPSAFLEGALDDVLDPRFIALGGGVTAGWLTLGVTGATDQAGRFFGQRRTINAIEGYARAEVLGTASWSVDLTAQTWLTNALSELGAAVEAGARAQYRFGEAQAVSVDFHTGYLGTRSLRGLFGPTYLAKRDPHAQALDAADGRASLGGEVRIQAGKWRVALSYSDAIGAGAISFDSAALALVELRGISLGSSRLLDARALYVARAFARSDVADVAQAGLRLRLNPWFAAESYFQLGIRGEGGAGVTLEWTL